jgi:uncharacterized membrane protein
MARGARCAAVAACAIIMSSPAETSRQAGSAERALTFDHDRSWHRYRKERGMATLTALKFDTPDGAAQMEALMLDLQKQQLIRVEDAAIVTWPPGKKKPQTRQLQSLAGPGALMGAFWGLLFGLLFFVPFLGMAIGAGMGALAASMADVGINDKFINEARSKVTEGTSALFLLTSGAVEDRVTEAIKARAPRFEIISTNLSKEQEDKLREVFAE